ncbi:MAG: phage tail protein I [Coprobacillus sp.]|nr:phage tail protein I [Coprobacillus sp.]
MIDYYDGQITDLLPSSYTEEASVQALSLALREGTRLLYRYCQNVYLYCSIDTMSDTMLDYLAKELRTQYYSDEFDIELKRSLVRNTMMWYMHAGTPAAVEELVSIVFGEGTVEEWWEFDGEPYWFRIFTDVTLDETNVSYFSEMVKRVKNTRSHLDAIGVHREVEMPFYSGAAVYGFPHTAVIDGYNVNYEIDQTVYTNTGAVSLYKPAAIMDDLKYESEVNQTITAATALDSTYKQIIKED